MVLRNPAEPEFHQAVLEVLEFMSRSVRPKSSEGLAVQTVAGALQRKFFETKVTPKNFSEANEINDRSQLMI